MPAASAFARRLAEAVGAPPLNLLAKTGWRKERKNDLSTTELRQSQPHDEAKFENVVEWQPVSDRKGGFKHVEESENNPVSEPLCVINLGNGEKSIEWIVAGDEKSGQIGQELAPIVNEDQEEVDKSDTAYNVDLWDTSLFLQII